MVLARYLSEPLQGGTGGGQTGGGMVAQASPGADSSNLVAPIDPLVVDSLARGQLVSRPRKTL
jgi:hypothetical protein